MCLSNSVSCLFGSEAPKCTPLPLFAGSSGRARNSCRSRFSEGWQMEATSIPAHAPPHPFGWPGRWQAYRPHWAWKPVGAGRLPSPLGCVRLGKLLLSSSFVVTIADCDAKKGAFSQSRIGLVGWTYRPVCPSAQKQPEKGCFPPPPPPFKGCLEESRAHMLTKTTEVETAVGYLLTDLGGGGGVPRHPPALSLCGAGF